MTPSRTFIAVQQRGGLRDVGSVGRGADHRVHQSRLGVHANVGLHAKVLSVSLLGLVHLGIVAWLAFLVELGAAMMVASTMVPRASKALARQDGH
jgi:hypothetical protein